ncbi:MAG: oligosaccharide flippase family protein [Proteobacteria bacterium]|nr:oligosaccharide flippase family protein [Pseudomonadota bacterium]
MKLANALVWTTVAVVARYALKLLGNLTLARLVSAEAFGQMAIVLAVVNGIEAITDVGTKAALIRSPRTDPAWLNTAWTLGIVRGVAIAVIVAVAAVPAAAFFREPELAAMIAVTGLMSALVGLRSIGAVIAVRDLDARKLAFVELAELIACYVLMIGWAWYWPSAWALLVGTIASCAIYTVLSYIVFAKRPHRFAWDRAVLRELVGFGKWVMAASLIGFFILQGDRFAVGRLAGIVEAGIYTIAVTWAMSLQTVFGMFLSRLYLPVVAQLRRDSGDGIAAANRLRRSILAVMLVPFTWAAGCAVPIIGFLYPATYSAAGPVMAILVVGAWFATLEFLYNDQLMLANRPNVRFRAQILSIAAMAAGLIALRGHYSLIAIAAIFAGGSFIRAGVLLIANDARNLRPAFNDMAITAVFVVSAWLLSHLVAAQAPVHGAAVLLLASFAALAPIGAVLCWFALRQILSLSPANVQDEAAADRIGRTAITVRIAEEPLG